MALYILAFVVIALFVFCYFQTRLFMQVITRLVDSLTSLKAYAMGQVTESKARAIVSPEPAHPDFGMGKILDEVEEAENKQDERENF